MRSRSTDCWLLIFFCCIQIRLFLVPVPKRFHLACWISNRKEWGKAKFQSNVSGGEKFSSWFRHAVDWNTNQMLGEREIGGRCVIVWWVASGVEEKVPVVKTLNSFKSSFYDETFASWKTFAARVFFQNLRLSKRLLKPALSTLKMGFQDQSFPQRLSSLKMDFSELPKPVLSTLKRSFWTIRGCPQMTLFYCWNPPKLYGRSLIFTRSLKPKALKRLPLLSCVTKPPFALKRNRERSL